MEQKPIFTVEGVTFVYVQYNNLILMSVTKRNSNVALMLVYLYKLVRYAYNLYRLYLVSYFADTFGTYRCTLLNPIPVYCC